MICPVLMIVKRVGLDEMNRFATGNSEAEIQRILRNGPKGKRLDFLVYVNPVSALSGQL